MMGCKEDIFSLVSSEGIFNAHEQVFKIFIPAGFQAWLYIFLEPPLSIKYDERNII